MSKYQLRSVTCAELLSFTLLAGMPYVALAQNASDAETVALEEVIVTAERREGTEATTPISMAVVTGAELAERQLKTLNDLQSIVPGLAVANYAVSNFVNIRGIGNAVTTPGTTSGVSVFHDGVFEHDSSGLSTPFFDIESVEVLRGPQGTFVGQSSTGGAILINSRSPTLDKTDGYVEGTLGNYANTRFIGALNLPINSVLAARVSVNLEHRDSFYYQAGSIVSPDGRPSRDPGNVNSQDFRVGLLWQPVGSFHMLLKIEQNRSNTDGTPGAPNEQPYVDPGTGAIRYSTFYPYSTHVPFLLNFDYSNTHMNETYERYSLDAQYETAGGYALRSVSGYQSSNIFESSDGDGSSANAIRSYNTVSPRKYYSQDLTILSPSGGRVNWILGASVFYRESTATSFTANFAAPYGPTAAMTTSFGTKIVTDNLQHALYGQIGYQITPSLELQVGLRENWDKNVGDNVLRNLHSEYDDSKPTGKVGLNWKAGENQFLYAFFSRGYKSGGVNIGQQSFKPEQVDDYELGWKGQFLENRVRTEVGAYYMDYKNMQIQALNFVTGATDAVSNVASAKLKGVEASIESRFGGLGLTASAAYNDSALGSLTTVATYRLPDSGAGTLGPQCGTGVTGNCFNYSPYVVDLDGQANTYSPKLTYSLSADYGIPLDDATLRFRTTFSHTDRQYASVFQSDNYFILPERDLLSASLAYEAGSWEAQLYGTNLSDETYVMGLFRAVGRSTVYYGAPRQYGLRVSYKF